MASTNVYRAFGNSKVRDVSRGIANESIDLRAFVGRISARDDARIVDTHTPGPYGARCDERRVIPVLVSHKAVRLDSARRIDGVICPGDLSQVVYSVDEGALIRLAACVGIVYDGDDGRKSSHVTVANILAVCPGAYDCPCGINSRSIRPNCTKRVE